MNDLILRAGPSDQKGRTGVVCGTVGRDLAGREIGVAVAAAARAGVISANVHTGRAAAFRPHSGRCPLAGDQYSGCPSSDSNSAPSTQLPWTMPAASRSSASAQLCTRMPQPAAMAARLRARRAAACGSKAAGISGRIRARVPWYSSRKLITQVSVYPCRWWAICSNRARCHSSVYFLVQKIGSYRQITQRGPSFRESC